MPARHNQHDGGIGHKTRIQDVGIPVPGMVPHRLAVGIRPIFNRVIDQRQVRPTPRDRRAYARSDISTANVSVPAIGGAAVCGQFAVGEQLRILRAVDDVPDIATKVACQVAVVAGGNDLAVRVPPDIPTGESSACQFRLGVTGRAENHQAVAFATLHGLERGADDAVVMRHLKSRVGILRISQQVLPRPPPTQ